MPIEPDGQDDYEEDLMRMEDREIKFWLSVNKLPNFIDEDDWKLIIEDYIERMRIAKEDGVKYEKKEVTNILKRLEVKDYDRMKTYGKLPKNLESIVDIVDRNLVSIKWGEILFNGAYLFEFESDAKERAIFYSSVENGADNMYEMWLDYKAEVKTMSGDTIIDYIHEEYEPIDKTDNNIINTEPEEQDEKSEWNF
jgi:hypothetical protein